MSSLISSGSDFIQAVMLRVCFGLVFVGLTVAAHTAQSEENPFAPDLDILTIQSVRANGDLLTYRFNASITLTRSADTAPAGSGFSNTPQLHAVAEPGKETVWPTNSRWQVTPYSDHVSLSPALRFESKGGRFEIKPRRHSVWFGWRKTFP